jgi:hypothetical protein
MNQRSNEAEKLSDIQLMADAFISVLGTGRALSSAELAAFWTPSVSDAVSRHNRVERERPGTREEADLSWALSEIREAADHGKPLSVDDLTDFVFGGAHTTAKRYSTPKPQERAVPDDQPSDVLAADESARKERGTSTEEKECPF